MAIAELPGAIDELHRALIDNGIACCGKSGPDWANRNRPSPDRHGREVSGARRLSALVASYPLSATPAIGMRPCYAYGLRVRSG